MNLSTPGAVKSATSSRPMVRVSPPRRFWEMVYRSGVVFPARTSSSRPVIAGLLTSYRALSIVDPNTVSPRFRWLSASSAVHLVAGWRGFSPVYQKSRLAACRQTCLQDGFFVFGFGTSSVATRRPRRSQWRPRCLPLGWPATPRVSS